jgi:hypothetical protein
MTVYQGRKNDKAQKPFIRRNIIEFRDWIGDADQSPNCSISRAGQ